MENILITKELPRTTQEEKLDLLIEKVEILISQTSNRHPKWIQVLIDEGFVAEDGITVLTDSLNSVANRINDEKLVVITEHHLKRFVKASDGKPYSKSAIKKAINIVNT